MEPCKICQGQLWVCENHPDVPWDDGKQECCGGAGMPCECNRNGQPKLSPGSKVVFTKDGYVQ